MAEGKHHVDEITNILTGFMNIKGKPRKVKR
jgi:hypothetical protein